MIPAAAILSSLKTRRELIVAWTEITRRKYRRDGLRYASDTTDAEWAVIEPHMPPPANCGRPRGTSLREVVNAIFYIAQTGCQAHAAWQLSALHDRAALSMAGAPRGDGRPSTMHC